MSVCGDLSLQDSLQKSHPVSSQVYFSKSYSIYIYSFDVFESECSILLLCYHDYSISHYFFKQAFCLFLPLFFWNSNNLQVISFFWYPIDHMGLPWWLRWWKFHLQCRTSGFDPWVGMIPWRREWQPTPVFLSGESHGQRSLMGYSP